LQHLKSLKEGKGLKVWVTSLFLSVLFNGVLFYMMPSLVRYSPVKKEFSEPITPVNVIRFKREDSPVHRKEKKVKRIIPQKKALKTISKKIFISPSIRQNLSLPFEINPKLPPLSGGPKVDAVCNLSLGLPHIKGVYGIGEIDHPLTPLVRIPPLYPMHARRRGIEGWVRVRFIVNEEGMVTDPVIVESHPKGIFEDSVLRCVTKWRFIPGTIEGIKVKTLVETTIRFVLKKG